MKQFSANFFGVINVNNALLPYMRAARTGSIVIVGSRHAWKTQHPVRVRVFSSAEIPDINFFSQMTGVCDL